MEELTRSTERKDWTRSIEIAILGRISGITINVNDHRYNSIISYSLYPNYEITIYFEDRVYCEPTHNNIMYGWKSSKYV